MTLVAFLRGVNVGGHRRLRPRLVAEELRRFDVVNVGAAGTFVVRAPGTAARFRAELARCLPFETDVMTCTGNDLLRLVAADPLAGEAVPGVVPFVSVLAKRRTPAQPLPQRFPRTGDWGMRVIGQSGCFVYGVYRRQMQAVGQLAQLDRLFGVPVTTRNWNTILAIAKILDAAGPRPSAAKRSREVAGPG